MPERKLGPNRGNAGKGRPKGSLNKLSSEAKDVIASVATELGGAERLLTWVKADPKNETTYWATIYPKLLPMQVNGQMTTLTHEQFLDTLK